jgi:hypothetical protein
MAKTTFDEFVKRQQAEAQVSDIDWAKQRDEWLEYLDALYTNIASILDEYISSGQINLSYREMDLNEENIGTYRVRQLILKIGGKEIDFKPIGTLLIGMKGRVDVYGPAGSATLVLVNSKATGVRSLVHVSVHILGAQSPPRPPITKTEDIIWKWKIMSRPEGTFVPIDAETLYDLILEVANG